MKRYTAKDLRREIDFVNGFSIAGTDYKIRLKTEHGVYYLYQFRKGDETRPVRALYAGSARECKAYLRGLTAHWYFTEDNEIPF